MGAISAGSIGAIAMLPPKRVDPPTNSHFPAPSQPDFSSADECRSGRVSGGPAGVLSFMQALADRETLSGGRQR